MKAAYAVHMRPVEPQSKCPAVQLNFLFLSRNLWPELHVAVSFHANLRCFTWDCLSPENDGLCSFQEEVEDWRLCFPHHASHRIQCWFREAFQGSISIDHVDVATVPLRRLRTAVTVIPQVRSYHGVKDIMYDLIDSFFVVQGFVHVLCLWLSVVCSTKLFSSDGISKGNLVVTFAFSEIEMLSM